MRRRTWVFGWALLTLTGVVGGPVAAADKEGPFEAYEKAARPGPQHKALAAMVGSWTFSSKMWLKPGGEPMTWKGTAERKMVLGGRFLQEDVTAELFGKPFRGRALNGYDNAKGKYVGTWIDSMGTGIAQSVGTADKSGKVITYVREEFDPAAKKAVKVRDVLRLLSKDKQVMEMYKPLPDGKEFKVMEIVFVRKPAKPAK